MILARVVNVRANFCLKFIQNTDPQKKREKRREKRGFGSVRDVHPK
jgi:hypothetical protein